MRKFGLEFEIIVEAANEDEAVERAKEILKPVEIPVIFNSTPQPKTDYVKVRDVAYTEITTRILMRVLEEHPEIFIEEAYLGHPPKNWRALWREEIQEERNKY